MSQNLTVAACQISAGANPRTNLRVAVDAVERAAAAGADVVVLPEATQARFGTPLAQVAEALDGPFATRLRSLADDLGVLLVAGMFTPAGDGRVHNTLLVTGRGVDTSYDKIHLFDAFGSRESDTVAPGTGLVTVEALGTTFGLATCYDLRFADQFTALGRAGAEVVLVPASWGDGPGEAEQWDLLTRARALDAQAWVVACDQAWTAPRGSDPLGLGRSVVVDPSGTVRARLGAAADLLLATIDPGQVEEVRRRVPVVERAVDQPRS